MKQITAHDIYGNQYEVLANRLEFRFSVYGLLLKENKILLIKEFGKLGFPGGGVHLDEKLEEALKREIFEETGYRIESKKLLTVDDSYFKLPGSGKFVHSIFLFYKCEILSGQLTDKFFTNGEKKTSQKANWYELDKINESEFNPDYLEILRTIIHDQN